MTGAMAQIGQLELALHHHNAGELDRAEPIYRALVEHDPGDADGWHLLGVLLDQGGDPRGGAELIRRAIALDDQVAEYHDNLGLALGAAGELEGAIAAHRRAVDLAPGSAVARNNLGAALERAGRGDEAEAAFRAAIAVDPRHPDALRNLAVTLGPGGGSADEAEALLRRAVALAPDDAQNHNAMGNALKARGDLTGAVGCYQRALGIDPTLADAHGNLGSALRELGHLQEALDCYDHALQLGPERAALHNNRGNVLGKLGRFDDAIDAYERALGLDPDYAAARHNLGLALKDCGLLAEARDVLGRSLELQPELAAIGARYRLGCALYDEPAPPDEELAEHVAFARRFGAGADERLAPPDNDRDADRRLRVGILSSDLRDHPVARNIASLFENRAATPGLELICYAEVKAPDPMTVALRGRAHGWRTVVGMTDREVAQQIRDDRIDVLLCLAGHFDANRPLVASYGPAPLHVAYHDAATSGIELMHHFIADEVLVPRDCPQPFVEELQRLPVYYSFMPLREAPPPAAPSASRVLTFGSFNNPAKISPATVELWAALLRAAPGSRLLLKYLNRFAGRRVRGRVLELLERNGVGPDRVMFDTDYGSLADHLATVSQVDVVLDAFPFSGSSTTYDALWMGVPVVTLSGDRCVSNMSASILAAAGLGAFVARTPAGYVDRALRLGENPDLRANLRRSLRPKLLHSPLLDGQAHARSVERLLRGLWHRWCAGQ